MVVVPLSVTLAFLLLLLPYWVVASRVLYDTRTLLFVNWYTVPLLFCLYRVVTLLFLFGVTCVMGISVGGCVALAGLLLLGYDKLCYWS